MIRRWLQPLLLWLTLFGAGQAAHASAPAGPSAAPAAAAWVPSADEQFLFELRTQRLRVGEGVRGYVGEDRVCVVMADVTLALDVPIRVDTQLRRATGWAFDERRQLVIDRDAGEVTIASNRQRLAATDIIDVAEGWCVDPMRLGEWLGVRLTPNSGEAALVLRSDTPLPFEAAIERRQRAARVRGAASAAANVATLPRQIEPYRALRLPSADVDVQLGFSRQRDGAGVLRAERRLNWEIFASGEFLGASVDARLASTPQGAPGSLRMRAYRQDPDAKLLGPLRATYAAAGDVVGYASPIGGSLGSGRGAVVTNRPPNAPDSFDRTRFEGDLPAGWDVELYRNGQLIAADSVGANGRYLFEDVRLLFGVNRFEIVGYGPQGQQRNRIETYNIDGSAVPAGQLHYWLAAIDEGRDLIEFAGQASRVPRSRGLGWRFGAGLEYGIDQRTSAGMWIANLSDGTTRRWNAEAALRRGFGSTLGEVALAWQPEGQAARLNWTGSLGSSVYFNFQSLHAWGTYRFGRDGVPLRFAHRASFQFSPRIGGAVLPVTLEGEWRRHIDGQQWRSLNAGVSGTWRKLSFGGQVRWSDGRVLTALGQPSLKQSATELVALANWRSGRWAVRGEAVVPVGPQGVMPRRPSFSTVAEWAVSEQGELRAQLSYDARWRLGVGYQHRFRRFALSGTVELAQGGGLAAGVALSTSIGPDPIHGGVRFERNRLASQGAAMAELFIDDNANGRRDAGEAAAAGVELVSAGGQVSTTNAAGEALIDGLAPYTANAVRIDEATLPSPTLRPRASSTLVVARPAVLTRLSIPLVPTGEVEGWLRDSGGVAVSSATLELVGPDGRVASRTSVDEDGMFLFESVSYGRYSLRIAAPENLSLVTPQRADIGRAASSVRLGVVVVERRDAALIARGAPPPPDSGAAAAPALRP